MPCTSNSKEEVVRLPYVTVKINYLPDSTAEFYHHPNITALLLRTNCILSTATHVIYQPHLTAYDGCHPNIIADFPQIKFVPKVTAVSEKFHGIYVFEKSQHVKPCWTPYAQPKLRDMVWYTQWEKQLNLQWQRLKHRNIIRSTK